MPHDRALLADLLESSVAALAIIDDQGRYLLRSAGLAALTGHEVGEGEDILHRIGEAAADEHSAREMLEGWRHHQATGEPVERTVAFRHVGGEQRWVRLHLVRHGQYRILHALDISDLVHAQQALAESEAQHRKLVENLPVGIYSLSEPMSGEISSANPAILSILGFDSVDEVLGNSSAILYENPEDRVTLVRKLLDNEFQRSNTIRFEVPLLRRDGQSIHARLTIHGTFDADNALTRVDGVLEDITQQDRDQRALEQSEQRFRSFFETAPVGMAILDQHGIVQANPALCRMLGLEPCELVGRTMHDLTHPHDLQQSLDASASLHRGELPLIQMEKRYLRADGSVLHARTTVTLGQGALDRPPMSFVMIEDITERKAMEEDLLKVQKLESLGVLAGGIAHDFNNMLTGVLGNVSMVRDRLPADSPLGAYLERAQTAALRARDLTLQLQTFASGGEPMRRVIALDELVHESADLCFRGSRAIPTIQVAPQLPLAELDAGQVAQALNNLFINAIQALPNGGTVDVTLDEFTLDADELPPLPPGRYLRVVVSDSGVGIHADKLERIFDPYFTTKRSGRGLGLATAFSVVKRHGGHIQVESTLGEGSTFTIYLPASTATQPDIPASDRTEPSAGSGRVLVMDDEESIRELVCELLEHFGYQVDAACHGDEAVVMARLAVKQGRPYRAAILDLTIPGGRGGREIIDELHAVAPELRAIVMSGYSTDATLAHHQRFGFAGAVAKPCSAKALVGELQRVLQA